MKKITYIVFIGLLFQLGMFVSRAGEWRKNITLKRTEKV